MPIMPLCIKGKLYAKAVIVYITTAFYAIEFGVKSPCEESWPPLQSYSYIKGNFYTNKLNYWGQSMYDHAEHDRNYMYQLTQTHTKVQLVVITNGVIHY